MKCFAPNVKKSWNDELKSITQKVYQKSDNLQYNTLGRWVDRLIDQASDGPSNILID